MTKKEYLINNIDKLASEICVNNRGCNNCPLDNLNCCIYVLDEEAEYD